MTYRGAVRRFAGDRSMVVIGVKRDDGNYVALPVALGLAEALVAQYGVPALDGTNVEALIGRRVEYEESATGTVVRLAVLAHSSRGCHR